MKPATAGGRVEIAGGLQIDITEVPEYSNDTQAAAGGSGIVGGIYIAAVLSCTSASADL